MKIAIVHDCFREYGGAERVVEAMHEIWPEAPVYTSFVDWRGLGRHAYRFKDWNIRTSWVQHFWLIKKFISPLRFLIPLVWKQFDFSSFDVVITSSGWFISRGVKAGRRILASPGTGRYPASKGLPFKGSPLHVCYIHHPPRNLYGYATGSDLQKYWFVRAYATIINFFLRQYDFRASQKVDYFIANSKETARRVEKIYRRKSIVIYPPITISKEEVLSRTREDLLQKNKYFLSAGRLTWAKRVDLAIKACNELKLPLIVVGTGKEEAYLKSIAGPTITFSGPVSDDELANLYQNAKAFIFCALDEDFGMVPVEAMAHGTPVIALSQGGVKETVIDPSPPTGGSGQATGVLFEKPEVADLKLAIGKFVSRSEIWLRQKVRKNCIIQAKKFSKENFQKEIKAFIFSSSLHQH